MIGLTGVSLCFTRFLFLFSESHLWTFAACFILDYVVGGFGSMYCIWARFVAHCVLNGPATHPILSVTGDGKLPWPTDDQANRFLIFDCLQFQRSTDVDPTQQLTSAQPIPETQVIPCRQKLSPRRCQSNTKNI